MRTPLDFARDERHGGRMKRLAIYCGSATPADPLYIEAAAAVGSALARRGIGVVYGGGRLGLMGAVADAALAAGGEVIGIIPEALVGAEVAHRGCTELYVVPGMHERKRLFTDLSDGFVTLPGGVGTMDELWERSAGPSSAIMKSRSACSMSAVSMTIWSRSTATWRRSVSFAPRTVES